MQKRQAVTRGYIRSFTWECKLIRCYLTSETSIRNVRDRGIARLDGDTAGDTGPQDQVGLARSVATPPLDPLTRSDTRG